MFLTKIRQKLQEHIDLPYKARSSSFSKESFESYGVRTPVVRQIVREFWPEIKKLTKAEIWDLCEKLLESKMAEEITFAFNLAFRLRAKFEPKDYEIFYHWLDKYVNTWFYCDDFCGGAFGYLIYSYPELSQNLFSWAQSPNRFMRRAAAVVLIYSLRKKRQEKLALEMALILLEDTDDLVRKGYGWMLKVMSQHFENLVFDFVKQHQAKMPRVAWRYALEKMDKEKKQMLR